MLVNNMRVILHYLTSIAKLSPDGKAHGKDIARTFFYFNSGSVRATSQPGLGNPKRGDYQGNTEYLWVYRSQGKRGFLYLK